MVVDMRLEKQFDVHAYDHPYHFQLMGEFFNVANHQNVTGVITTAYNLSSNSSVTAGCTGSRGGADAGGMLDSDLRSEDRQRHSCQRIRCDQQLRLQLRVQPTAGAAVDPAGLLDRFDEKPISNETRRLRLPRFLVG